MLRYLSMGSGAVSGFCHANNIPLGTLESMLLSMGPTVLSGAAGSVGSIDINREHFKVSSSLTINGNPVENPTKAVINGMIGAGDGAFHTAVGYGIGYVLGYAFKYL